MLALGVRKAYKNSEQKALAKGHEMMEWNCNLLARFIYPGVCSFQPLFSFFSPLYYLIDFLNHVAERAFMSMESFIQLSSQSRWIFLLKNGLKNKQSF